MSRFRLGSDIDGFMEVMNRSFPPVSISLGAFWRFWCFPLFIHYRPHVPTISVSYPLCNADFLSLNVSLAGAKGLQSPPQSVFSSSPTSPSRPPGPRRSCFRQSVRAGPTACSAECRRPSAKACCVKCTKLQVSGVKLPHRVTVPTSTPQAHDSL